MGFPFRHGCLIAVVTLRAVFQIDERSVPRTNERLFGDYTPGRYAWHLADVWRLRFPYPCRGRQRLFAVDVPTDSLVDYAGNEIPVSCH
jgi:hypothetical protein